MIYQLTSDNRGNHYDDVLVPITTYNDDPLFREEISKKTLLILRSELSCDRTSLPSTLNESIIYSDT